LKNQLLGRHFHPLKPLPTKLSPEGQLRPPVRCLLCDIYGTLLISGSGDLNQTHQKTPPQQAIVELMARYGVGCTDTVLHRNLQAAIRETHCRAKAKGIDYPEVDIVKIWSQLLPSLAATEVRAFAVEYEMIMNPVWPMPGLVSLIKTCRNHDIRLGVISNAQFFTPLLFDWFLDADLQALGFDPQLIIFSYRYGRAKPSPLLFKMAADQLRMSGIDEHEVAFIGNDVRNDIAPSQQTGFQTILFAGDSRSLRLRTDDPGCNNVIPDLRITQLSQLASYLFEN